MESERRTVRQACKEALVSLASLQRKQGVTEYSLKCWVEELIAHILSCHRLDLSVRQDTILREAEWLRMEEGVRKMLQGYPLDYCIGAKEFYGCHLCVDERVLIPRPETEILVDWIAQQPLQGILWDLCTGSGCIGISLKKRFPHLSVSLSDLSSSAVEVAAKNAQKNGVDVPIHVGDLLEPFSGRKADVVVCNPPYVTVEEYASLDASVRCFEPKIALMGGVRGTEFYERLAEELPQHLSQGARVFLEIGASQGMKVKKIFHASHWRHRELRCDWSGKDRFFSLKYDPFLT